MGAVHNINGAVARSCIGRWFKFEGSGVKRERLGSRFLTEIRAGVTTWAAMAYIISVNASIISQSGGNCVCTSKSDPSCMTDPEYLSCVNDVRKDLITSTAAISALSSFLMGAVANMPIGMAPGLGLNAYFTFSIVGVHGTGRTSYGEALAAVFLEGWIFVILSLLGIRQWLARVLPQSLVLAFGAGIGLFIAFVGLTSNGLGVIGGDTTNFIGIGGCLPSDFVSPDLPNYCGTRVLRSPTMWLGIFGGGIFTILLVIYRVKGSLIIGIFLVSIISWPRPTSVTAFPYTPAGDEAFAFFSKVVAFHPIGRILNVLDYSSFRTGRVWYALVTFLYVDILDTTATLYTMAKFAGFRDPVTLDFEGSTLAYCVDAFSISMGSLFGTSPVTAFIESATGISEGGKTGMTGVTIGFMFLVSVFFAPLFASIPTWATGGALVIVGCLMMRTVKEINWNYLGDAIPAFLTILIIPLSYNIAYGVIAGISSYVMINGFALLLRKVTGIVPAHYEYAEPWVVPPGGLAPIWLRKLTGRYADPHGDMQDAQQMRTLDVVDDPAESSQSSEILTRKMEDLEK